VRLNIPLLPFVLEIRRRPLLPFRPRFTLLGLILAVGVAGLFFSLFVEAERLHRLGSYHAEQSILATVDKTPDDPRPPAAWHVTRSNQFHDAARLYDELVLAILLVPASLVVVAVVGRALDRLIRRRIVPTQE
jgi:hypothetical protein